MRGMRKAPMGKPDRMKTARRVEPTGRVQDNDMAKMKRAATPRKAAKTDVFARAAKLGISREELERVPTE